MKNLFLLLLIFFSLTGLFAQNYSLDFDGTDDYIQTSSSINIGNTFTIEFWMKVNLKDYGDPLSFGTDDFSLTFVTYADGRMLFTTGDGSSNWGNGVETSIGTLKDNTWYHITGISTGSNLKLYINGILIGESNENSNLINQILNIGSRPATNYNFNGTIDEVRIWNDIRTENEIRQNMYHELPNPTSEASLTAYYNFNSTAGGILTDNSSNSNTGTLLNIDNNNWLPSAAFFGPKNCLNFDGSDDYVNIPANTVLDNTNFTVELLAKMNGIPTYWNSLIDKGRYSTAKDWYILTNQGTLHFVFGVHDIGEIYVFIGDYNWHHIAVTCNGTEFILYIDGVEKGTLTGSYTPSTNAINIGKVVTGNNYFNGNIDEVRIWNDVRTKDEIRENMFQTLTGNETGLVAYYNFDNTSGTTLQDFSGNNNDGTLNNMDDSDWESSSAFNTWLNTNSTDWTTTSNWSQNSTPISTDNVGIYNYSGAWPCLNGTPTVYNLFVGTSANLALYSNMTVNGNFFVYDNIDLNSHTITLGSTAYLFEESYVIYGTSGKITTTRDLNNISSEDIGGLGAIITTTENMGSTIIERHHSQIDGATNSIKRWFVIEPTNNTNLDASLTFNYLESELNGNTESTLSLYRSTDNGSTWSDMGSTRDVDANTLSLSSTNHFSWWTATKTNSTLPVEITNFDGINLQNKNKLNWNTASETNNKDFIIERSIDGTNFTQICKVEGKKNSNLQNKYQYFDYNIKSNKAYYYRLSNEDFDGTINNIKTIYLENPNLKSNIKVYPNPFKDYISINLNNGSNYGKVTIFNSKGIPVLQKEINSFTKINTQNLEKGNYLIQIISNNKLDNYKILK